MTGTLQRRLRVLIATGVTAIVCWIFIPGTRVDRMALTAVIGGGRQAGCFVSGNGSHASPWKVQSFAAQSQSKSRQSPVFVALGDDPEGFFQSSPASPIDMAVIFTNFQRLGVKKAATAAVLAWDAPDPIGLMAMDKAIDHFESMVMAAPLTRGAVPEPLPPAFRRASIPISNIQGDVSLLPVVNRIPLPGIILGRNNTLAGFQTLDSEPLSEFVPLIARWSDRAVFAFPILAALQKFNLPVDGIEIQMGKSLKLGPRGPIIPLDRYGRLSAPLQPVVLTDKIPAEVLIDGKTELFSNQVPESLILMDDRSGAEPATRLFSEQLPAWLGTLATDSQLGPARLYPRMPTILELVVLAVLSLALAALCGLSALARSIAYLNIALACLAAQCFAVENAQLWLPGIPALAAILVALLSSQRKRTTPATSRALSNLRPAQLPVLPKNP